MARGKKEVKALTLEEKLEQALVPEEEQPYAIPENWCWIKFGWLIELISGRDVVFSECNDEGLGIPYILGASNINNNIFTVERWIETPQVISRKNDILLSVKGTIGKLYIQQEESINISRQMMAIRSSEELNVKFVYYFLQNICDELREAGNGLIPGISRSDILDKTFMLPPFYEQQRIVTRIESLFAKLDEAKEKAQAVIDGFELRKSAILHKAFTGELTEQWRKEYGIGLDSWIKASLSDVCKVNPKKMNTKDLPDDLEISFFPMSSLSEIYGEITEPQTRLLKEVRTGFTNFFEGDVVFAKITPCMENGKSAIIGRLVNNIGYGTTEFYVLRCGEKLYNRYLYHLVRDQHFRDQAKAVMTGAVGQQRVPKEFLEAYLLKLPSVIEQQEICHILDKIFLKEMKAKQAAESVLAQIDTMKKAILARAFHGELGTNNPSDENAVELLKEVLAEKS